MPPRAISNPKTILLVEDSPTQALNFRTILEQHGYQVVQVPDGAQALEVARREPPDLILADNFMPVMDGFTLLREMKSDPGLARIPFIMFTGNYTQPEDLEFGLSLGAEHYLLKTIPPAELVKVVEQTLASGVRTAPKPLTDSRFFPHYSETLFKKLISRNRKLETAHRRLLRSTHIRTALGEISRNLITQKSLDNISSLLAQKAVEMTESENSFVGYHDPASGNIYAQAWGGTRAERCRIPAQQVQDMLGTDRGFLQLLLKTKPSLLANEPLKKLPSLKLPQGHIPLRRLIAVPVISLNTVHGLLIVANASRKYRPEDRWLMERLADLYTLAIERAHHIRKMEQLYTAVQQSPALVMITNTDGIIEFANPAYTPGTGFTPDEIIGTNTATLEAHDLREARQMRAHLATGKSWRGLLRNRKKDGGTYLEAAVITPLRDEQDRITHYVKVAEDVTRQKAAEEALIASERSLAQAQRIAHLGSWEMDLETGKCRWSDEFFRICGLEPGACDPTRETGLQIIHPDDRERAAEAVRLAIEQNQPYRIEKRLVRPDGEVRWVQAQGEIIISETGRPLKLLGSFLDITDRKFAEEMLREREQRVRRQKAAIIELTLDGVPAGTDPQPAFEKVCEILAGTVGVARTSIWKLSADESELCCLNLYAADQHTHSHGTLLKAAEIPRYIAAIRNESQISAGDVQQDPRTAELTANYLKPLGITSMLDAGIILGGQVAGVVCCEHTGTKRRWQADEESFVSTVAAFVAKMITESERWRTQEMLRKNEEKFRNVFEAANVGKSITAPNGLIFVNRAFAAMLGYTPQELQNTTWQELTPAEEIAGIQEIVDALIEGKSDAARFNKRYIHKDGRLIWADVSVALQRDENGRPLHFITTIIDISERRRVEAELENRVAELERFHRLSVDREMQMIELKQRINELSKAQGHTPPYRLDFNPGKEDT